MLQDWSLKLVQTPMVSEFHTWLQLPCQEKTYRGAMERAGREWGFQEMQMNFVMFLWHFGYQKTVCIFSILCTWIGFLEDRSRLCLILFQQLRLAYFCYYSCTVCTFTWANNHTHRWNRAGKWSLGVELFDKESKLGLLGDATWVSWPCLIDVVFYV